MSFRSLRKLSALVSSNDISCKEIASEIAANRASNYAYEHIYQTFDVDELKHQATEIDEASGDALKGAPISVKDAFGVAGYPTYGGGRTELPERWARDTGIVRQLRGHGALFSGKTQMVEFALGGLGQNPHWGAPVNPWDSSSERVCGGSSCGAGVSLWDGTAIVALAADIAGSVRVPASMSGAVGFRPTQGVWVFGDSYLGICPTLDSPGILTLSVDDAQFFFNAVNGRVDDSSSRPPRSLNGAKLGFSRFHFEQTQSDIARVVWQALQELSRAGAQLIEVDFFEYQDAYDFYMQSQIAAIECAAFINREFPNTDVLQDPFISGRLESMRKIGSTDHSNFIDKRKRLIGAARERMQSFDAFVTPTLPISPPLFSELSEPEAYTSLNRRVTLMTNPVNVLNLSSLTMPVGKDASGLPVGLQFVGRAHEDAAILTIAHQAEEILGNAIDVLGTPSRLGHERSFIHSN